MPSRYVQKLQFSLHPFAICKLSVPKFCQNMYLYTLVKLAHKLTTGFINNQDRVARIDDRKKVNRSEEQQTVEAGSGLLGDTEWERIISLINFNLGAQQKDTSRLRSMLFQAREVNLGATE